MEDQNSSRVTQEAFLDALALFDAKLDKIMNTLVQAIEKIAKDRDDRDSTIATARTYDREDYPSKSEDRDLADRSRYEGFVHPIHFERLIAIDPKLVALINFRTIPGCWIWRGPIVSDAPSHGIWDEEQRKTRRKTVRRWLFQEFFTEMILPQKERLDGQAQCREPYCVNPFHAVTIEWFAQQMKRFDVRPWELPFIVDYSTAFNKLNRGNCIRNSGVPEGPPPPQMTVLQRLQQTGYLQDQELPPPPAAPIEEERLQPDWDALMDLNEDDPKR